MPPRTVVRIPQRTVRLEVFDLHGHNGNAALDYDAFFRALSALSPRERREQLADEIVAIPKLRLVEGVYEFAAYVGSSETAFLVLNLETNRESVRHVAESELIATRTVGVIDPVRRLAVVQYVHRGVRAPQIAALLEKVAHALIPEFVSASLEFAYRAGDEFRSQLAKLGKIKSAALTLTRPNIDWTDLSDSVNEFAGDSNAHTFQISASAPRNDSLLKGTGVVKLIRELSRPNARSTMKSAVVKGTDDETGQPREVKLNKSVEARQVRVPLSGDLPNQAAVELAARNLIENPDVEAN